MFTGLIEEMGTVESCARGPRGMRIGILSPALAPSLTVGDSITVDGACQTVIAVTPSTFSVAAVGDTLEKTTFRALARGARVNLERAMRADGRFGGHVVTGHVTGTASIVSWADGNGSPGGELGATFLVLGLDPSWRDRVVAEGSIAVDGISLTVAEVVDTGARSGGTLRARISIIPHTRHSTTLARKKPGDTVNIELDILGSYVAAAVRAGLGRIANLDIGKLKEWGY
jgi:riboflavin synthase